MSISFLAAGAGALNAPSASARRSWLWVALALPSALIVWKFTGGWVLAYLVAAALLAPRAWRMASTRRGWSPLQAGVAATLTVLVVVAAMAYFYPRFNVSTPGAGADDDDALNVGVRALLEGRSPYGELTYLDNTLHQFPGAFLLAAPFTLLFGSSAWQNVFWLVAFWVVAARDLHSSTAAIRLSWVVLIASPVVAHGLVTGVGHLTNAISVLLGMRWLMAEREGTGRFGSARDQTNWLAAIFWGIALAARPNFFFLMPLMGAWLWRQRGPRAAAWCIGIAAATIVTLSAPFVWLDGLERFTPLEAGDALSRFDQKWPMGTAVSALIALVTLWCTGLRLSTAGTFLASALVLAIPVLFGTLLELPNSVERSVYFAGWGVFSMWFVFAAAVHGRWFGDYSSES